MQNRDKLSVQIFLPLATGNNHSKISYKVAEHLLYFDVLDYKASSYYSYYSPREQGYKLKTDDQKFIQKNSYNHN